MEFKDIQQCKRIMIIGNSSSGKSTLAHQLSEKLNIPVHHLDVYAHKPDKSWIRTPKDQFIKLHWLLIQNKRWIIEGNYSSSMQDRLGKADLIIFININRLSSLFNFLKRCFCNRVHFGAPCGAKNKVNIKMIKYIFIDFPKKAKRFKEILKNEDKVIYINSFRKLMKLKKELELETKNI